MWERKQWEERRDETWSRGEKREDIKERVVLVRRVQQEASQWATDGLQPEFSDTEEFQAEGREGGKVTGGRRRTRRAGRVVVCCRKETGKHEQHSKWYLNSLKWHVWFGAKLWKIILDFQVIIPNWLSMLYQVTNYTYTCSKFLSADPEQTCIKYLTTVFMPDALPDTAWTWAHSLGVQNCSTNHQATTAPGLLSITSNACLWPLIGPQ